MATSHPPDWACELPGGIVDPDGRRLGTAELQPLTGVQEDWLVSNPHVPTAVAVTTILDHCLVRLDHAPPDVGLVRRMLVGDRDYLMLQLRRITLGETISAVLRCPACDAKMEVDFAVQDVPVEPRPQTAANYTIEKRGRTLQFRLPAGRDQEALLGVDAAVAADALFERCLIDDGGISVSAEDRSAVSEAMNALGPEVDLQLEMTCPECTHPFVEPFDTTAFFLQEMRSIGTSLLREAHLLAFYYHWSEAEILNLRRDRRHAYLALLGESLRPE